MIFSRRSHQQILTLHPDLQRILRLASEVEGLDFAVIQGHRSYEEQARLYAQGRTEPGNIVTKVKPGEGKHQTSPCIAVDLCPHVPGKGLDWKNTERFAYLAGAVVASANQLGLDVRWGGNWDRDAEILTDQNFQDRGHFELVVSDWRTFLPESRSA